MTEIKEYRRRVNSKGAVVIPSEIRQLLGMRLRCEIRFRVTGKTRVELLPPTMTLEETFASVKPKSRPLDFKELRDSASGG